MLRIHQLRKEYKPGEPANDGISLQVGPGEVLGLLGHNGAGKTTLINQVVGLLRPTAGEITLDGHDLVADPAFARRFCALMPQAHAPLDGVSPRQAVETIGRIRGARRAEARERTAELLAELDIEEWADTIGERLSGGVRRLAAFAMAAVWPGRVVMLDEPTNDVDPVRRRLLWGQVRALAEAGYAVLLVTHNVAEAERSVDRLTILDQGRIVAKGTPAELRERAAGELRLELLASGTAPIEPEIPAAGPTRRTGRRHLMPITMATAPDALAWARRLRDAGTIDEFSITPTSLEDVYVGLIGNANGNDGSNDPRGSSAVAA
ncbi:ABC-2 type transport system ATP-binding protein [Lipingzhangella halophila]|uniref:ABC-2 type transport system ATP-binding protein n=1 Tax=Lipingzhangella halophila TaxID=1783352 RepID=A0A7W7RCT5_9ACTN|nr:ABC transporter ATP-binding protein [Lipingzhangella halophila]MBB4929631.1 ABC-2 type transport system ATP-binding protein [Lipingzhangella halophila]